MKISTKKYMSYYCINFSLYRFTVLVLLSCSFSFAQELDKLQVESDALVYEGNLASKENFIEAEKYYRKAISKKETNAKGAYNLGNAYYSSELYDEAISKLIEATKNGTKEEKHQAFHNIGNALMQNKKCREAVEAYKNALRNNPSDEESRYNLALAKECAKEQGDGESEDEKKDKEKDENKKEDQKEDSDKQQDKNEQNKDQDGDEKEENEGSDKKDNNGNSKDQEGDQKNPDQKNKNQQGKLSPQQVKNLLEAMNNEENKVQEKMNASKVKGVQVKTDKDW